MAERFHFDLIGGYALAWHDPDEILVVSEAATTGVGKMKIVSEVSPKREPGFCFSPVMKVLINGRWKYGLDLTDKERWLAYWDLQAETIRRLIEKCPVL